MTSEHASQLIQLVLAPSVTLTACGILVSGVLTRYSAINDRIRAMVAERWAGLWDAPEMAGQQRARLRARLHQLDLQLPLLFRRHRKLRQAALTLYAAQLLFVLSMVLMALGVFLPAVFSATPAVLGFLMGTVVMLAGLGQVMHETKLSDDAVRLEASRVLEAQPVKPATAVEHGTVMNAQPLGSKQAVLGEGIRWDADRAELLWVDIQAGQLFSERLLPNGMLEHVRTYDVGTTLGAAVPVVGGQGYVLAAGHGFARLSPDGTFTWLSQPASRDSRMNDGACDPQGRFWAGALSLSHQPGRGALYVLERDGRVRQVLQGLTLPNGIGWSPNGDTLYLVDSVERVIWAFDFDGSKGALSRQRALVQIGEDEGVPDGLTVDAQGDLWVAMYDGACVRHYAPDGALRERLPIPTGQVTSCGFGGPSMDTLFVTTATEHWSEAQRRADPMAGRLYQLPTRTHGIAARPFRPSA